MALTLELQIDVIFGEVTEVDIILIQQKNLFIYINNEGLYNTEVEH